MTAQVVGFVTRADAGLRKPRSVSRRITANEGGVAVHYGGPAQRITSHAGCLKTWRAWQAFHMDSRGWADLAYSAGFCDHGYVLAGRGFGVRTAANGTNAGNDDYLAAVWLGGENETPTRAALDALEWLVVEWRKAGAGRRVRPHRVFTGSKCPGGPLEAHAATLDNRDVPQPSTPPPAPAAGTIPAGGPTMLIVLEPDGPRQFVCDVDKATHISGPERGVLRAAGVPYVGADHDPEQRRDFLRRRGVDV